MRNADWSEQWIECPVCGEIHGDRTGCERCAREAADAEGPGGLPFGLEHHGYYDLTRGWICYASCPCRGGE